MEKTICLATNNGGKLREYKEMLSPLGYEVKSANELGIVSNPDETGDSYSSNALIKAKALSGKTSYPVIADDSGFEVAALNGFPGIHSSRFAASFGDDYQKAGTELYKRLKPGDSTAASFHCCICLIEHPGAEPLYFTGVCPGTILPEPHGRGGFGYDPFFHSQEADVDFGVCPEEVKNRFSHRYKALSQLLAYLKKN